MDQLDTAQMEQLTPEMADLLPDEIKQMLELQREQKLQRIQEIGVAIAKKRDDAVKARVASGIEEQWIEDEEAYQGIDDANRSEVRSYKPPTPDGSFAVMRRDPSRSTVFLNITRPYVDAAAARIADMLMPTDDRNWDFKPTPIPELEQQVMAALQSPQGQMPMPQPGMPADPMAQQPGMVQQPIDPAAIAEEVMAEAKKRADAGVKRVEDWLVQCQWHAEVRKVMEDCARIGTGILKGPTPVKRKNVRFTESGMQIEYTIDPESKWIDPWNFYPDGSCGENIHNGAHVFEKDTISVRKLRDLKGTPGYLSDMIDKVIEEGPGKSHAEDKQSRDKRIDDERYEIWYYYGILDKEDLVALGADAEDSLMDGIPAIITMVNDSVIKAALNPLDSGDFPYDVMVWQRKTGSWAGTGVSRQIRTPQRMVNAATRNMMDNAGLSGGPILVIRRGLVEPADNKWELTPRKIFYVKEEGDVRTVADAITSIIIPSNQQELSNIITFALKMAEDVTGLPQLLQGSMGNQAPDTVGGMQMVMNNASTVLRRIARTFDDCITEPHIRRYYAWLMEYGNDDEKGDFTIDARGSSALVERDIQNQNILNMAQIIENPSFGVDPKRWFKEMCKAQRLDPSRFQYSEEEQEQLAQQPQPEAPQVTVAKIRAQTDVERTKMQASVAMQKAKLDSDRDAIYAEIEARRDQVNAASRIEELKLKREIAFYQNQIKKGISVDEAKTRLAETAMKLRTTKELSLLGMQKDLHKHHVPAAQPVIEPAGRAAPGRSYEQ